MLINLDVKRRSHDSKQPVRLKIKTKAIESQLAMKWKELKAVTSRADLYNNLNNVKKLCTYTNATPIKQFARIGYTCAFCNSQYPDPADLKKHTINNHKDINEAYFMSNNDKYKLNLKVDITGLKCNLCTEEISTLNQMIDHLNVEHDKELYIDSKNYIIPFKFDTEMLQCCLCANTFSNFKTLQEHMNKHYRNYICSVCDAGFINKLKLRHHEISHNTNEYKCDHCPKFFNTEYKRRVHIKSVHLGENLKIRCGYCDEKFKDTRRRDKHIIIAHGASPLSLKCQACDKVFSMQKSLSIHIKRDHLMERRHKCTQCEMRFFTTSELKLHMAKHTKIRQFMCQICLKSYARNKTLKEHMRIHDDDRRFKCEYCGQAFVQKCSWKGHMRSKHGELV